MDAIDNRLMDHAYPAIYLRSITQRDDDCVMHHMYSSVGVWVLCCIGNLRGEAIGFAHSYDGVLEHGRPHLPHAPPGGGGQ